MFFSNLDLTHFLLVIILLLAVSHVGSYVFQKIKLPKVVGEIVGGLILGPTVLGYFFPQVHSFLFIENIPSIDAIASFQELGLLFLMFCSGMEIQVLAKNRERITSFIISFTGLLFPLVFGFIIFSLIDSSMIMGNAHDEKALGLVFAISIAVTSIPVISRILLDLKLMGTSFARIILSTAVIEDIVLYGALSIALSNRSSCLGFNINQKFNFLYHTAATVILFLISLKLGPAIFEKARQNRWNFLFKNNKEAFLMVVLFILTLLAANSGIAPMFGAFLAGVIIGRSGDLLQGARDSVKAFSFSTFIPIYFAIVGLRLDLVHNFNIWLFFAFLLGSSVIKVIGVYIGSRFAGQKRSASVNLGIALNARGGPGIILATIAYNTNIINGVFFSTLVLAALVTSSFSGFWINRIPKEHLWG